MSAPSVALEHVPGMGRSELRREMRRRRRDRRWDLLSRGALGLSAVFIAGTVAVNLWPDEDHSGASEPAAVAAGPPPAAPVVLPPPAAATVVTAEAPWEELSVELPTGTVGGWLVTDGRAHQTPGGTIHAPRVLPGQVGRAIVSVPADPTAAATFNLGRRQWFVTERYPTWDAANFADLQGANPQVPTVALISSLPTALRPVVVAR